MNASIAETNNDMAANAETELQELSRLRGVLTEYEDVSRRRRTATVESLLAVLGALGVPVRSVSDVPEELRRQRQQRHERGLEPVIVAWDGEPAEFELTLPVQHAADRVLCVVQPEDGSAERVQRVTLDSVTGTKAQCGQFATMRLRLPEGLRWGYYSMRIESPAGAYESVVISAPRQAYSAEEDTDASAPSTREWGCFLPLYALRSERNWGAGDFTDLEHLARWTAELGGSVVGTLPLLAAFLDDPCAPSPYAPASRLAWNEFYIDVTRIAEFRNCAAANELVESPDFTAALSDLRRMDEVDYRRLMALRRRVLEKLADDFFERNPSGRFAEFEGFLNDEPHVRDYARFRAAYERRRRPWHRWPTAMRDGRLEANDYENAAARYHAYVQWIAAGQLRTLADITKGGLYLDLPLGVRPDGYDVWRWQDLYATGASAGSPPDAKWTKGQDWSFPPLDPEAIRQDGYRHVRDYLAHHLRFARLLRIDHVMQFHRLYWIPRGLPPDQGVYVRYHPEEFYAILNLESQRSRTTIVGENLGTVPPEVNRAMDRHNLQRMYIVEYELASTDDDGGQGQSPAMALRQGTSGLHDAQTRPPRTGSAPDPASSPRARITLREPTKGSLAALNTHDMPTFAAWWRGEDVTLREEMALIDHDAVRQERAALDSIKADLRAWLHSQNWLSDSEADDAQVLRALLKFLAAGEAGVVLVNLEDLWLETRPQNVPGTGDERPNWRCKARRRFEDFSQSAEVRDVLRTIDELRRSVAASTRTQRDSQTPGNSR